MYYTEEQYKAICEYVENHRQELVDTVIRLVNKKSVKGAPEPGKPFGADCAAALAEGMKICEENGMSAVNRENYVAEASWGQGDKEIGFIAHLDVVPAGDGWQSDPFSGMERDGFIVGRGSRDNKAGFGAALIAINCIRELGIPIRSSLKIVMGSDEESGMSDMVYYVKNYKTPDFSIVTDCYFPVAHGEKGRLEGDILIPFDTEKLRIYGGEAPNIIPAKCEALLIGAASELEKIQELAHGTEGIEVQKEGQDVKLVAHGISAHASEPFKAVNAIWKLCSFLYDNDLAEGKNQEAVRFVKEAFSYYYGEYFGIDYEDEPSGKTTLITGMISSEDHTLKVNIDCRYSVTDKKERFMPIFQKKMEELGYTFETDSLTDSHFIPADHPVAVELTKIFNHVSGEDKKPYVLAGGTYASKVPNSVAFGPGNQREKFPYGPGHGDAHQPNESQDIAFLMDAVKMYALAIIELDGILHAEGLGGTE